MKFKLILFFGVLAISISCKKDDCLLNGDCEASTYESSYVEEQVTPPVQATAYYVDAEDGKEKNDGKSPEKAFESIAQLTDMTFAPGDQILFKRDQIHIGEFELKQGGTEDSRIYIAAYGSGAMPIVKSEDGSDLKSEAIAIFLNRADYVSIQNLNIHGGIQAVLLSNSNHAVIEGCRLGEDSKSGLRATGDYTEGDGSNYGIVHHCLIYSGASGNLGDRQSTDGIQLMDGASDWYIHHNEFKAWTHSAMSIKQIYNKKPNNNNTIERNLFECGDVDYMRALDITGGNGLSASNTFFYNIIRNQSVTSHLHGDGNEMAYNLFLGLKLSDATEQPWAVDFHVITNQIGGVDRTKLVCKFNLIYNNLFYNYKDGSGIRILDRKSGADYFVHENYIKNNIFYNVGKPIEMDEEPTQTYLTNNLFYNETGASSMWWSGVQYDLDSFEALTGVASSSIHANVEGDPLFVDKVNENFRLTIGSPAIDAGVSFGDFNLDFDGYPGTFSTQDIGPFEYH